MREISFLLVLALGLVVSGCTEQEVKEESTGIDFRMMSVSTDKTLYHSSETVNLTMIVYSNSTLENVIVTANGINGRMNEKKVLNLTAGPNEMSFIYKLPKCNVCGGIKAGSYNISCHMEYENISIDKSMIIDIQQ